MKSNARAENEIRHGAFVVQQGEQIWNWSSLAGQRRWQRRADLFSSFLGNNEKSVLEMGCGTGLFTAELIKTKNQITAIDISQDLLDIAQKRVGKNALFLVRDAHQSGFPDNLFDFVVGSSVLHHFAVESALPEIYRIIKPGGKFMFTEPNMLNPQIFLQKNISFFKKMAGDSLDETAFFRWFVLNKISKAGFENVVVEPFDFMHPALPEFLLDYGNPIFIFLEKTPLVREFAGSLMIIGGKPRT